MHQVKTNIVNFALPVTSSSRQCEHKEKIRKQKDTHCAETQRQREKKRKIEEKQQQHTRKMRKRFYHELGATEKRKQKRMKRYYIEEPYSLHIFKC